MMNTKLMKCFVGCVFLVLVAPSFAKADGIEQAKKHNLRGIAAVEMAKSESDLNEAAKEFRKAVEFDPKMAMAWNNLGMVEAKLKHYESAIKAFQEYVKLNPKGKQANIAREQIVKLEYYLERTASQKTMEANWSSNTEGIFRLTLTGNEFRMQSMGLVAMGHDTVTPYFKDMFGMYNSRRADGKTMITYIGRIEGDRVKGERIRASFTEGVSSCVVPETKVPFQGRLLNDGKNMQISFEEPHYRANWTGVFWGLNGCSEIMVDTNTRQELGFTRQ